MYIGKDCTNKSEKWKLKTDSTNSGKFEFFSNFDDFWFTRKLYPTAFW